MIAGRKVLRVESGPVLVLDGGERIAGSHLWSPPAGRPHSMGSTSTRPGSTSPAAA